MTRDQDIQSKVDYLRSRQNPRAFVLGILESGFKSLEIYYSSDDAPAKGGRSTVDNALNWLEALKIAEG